jgi:glycosyltransferase involved in cell wall biosynthesis
MKKTKIDIVIPAYNEAERIGAVLKEVTKYKFDVIVVDDGSWDETAKVVKRYKVRLLKHGINLGVGAARKTGVEAAWKLGADAVVMLDADGQHDPNNIPDFIGKIEEGYDIVFGSRNLGFNVPLVRFLGNKFAAVLISVLFGIYRGDLLCGYIAFTKSAYKKIVWESTGYGVETEIVVKTGKNKLKYDEVPIEAKYLDKYKGASILDAISILPSILKWKFLV